MFFSATTITSSLITDASIYQEFKILNFLKIDVYNKFKNVKEIYDLKYRIHVAEYLSLSYNFHTTLTAPYKEHRDNCNCKIKEACFIIVPIPQYITVDVDLVPEKCLIRKYETYALIDTKDTKRLNVKSKKRTKTKDKVKSICSGNSHLPVPMDS